MPTKEALKNMNVSELAQQCQRVARDPKAVHGKAMAVYNEWTVLFPASEKTKLQVEKEAEENVLKARMIEFLTAVL